MENDQRTYQQREMWTGEMSRHLGDNICVDFDGYAVWLRANSPGGEMAEIRLVPDVVDNLGNYFETVRRREARNGK